jgi:hypothetical protein
MKSMDHFLASRVLAFASRRRAQCPPNAAAWTLGRWVAAGALKQQDVEDALYEAAEVIGLVADDSDRQCWATIRSGLGAGLLYPIE